MLGRFVSEDPLGFEGSGLNFYSYVSNNPTNFVDPFGLTATETITGPTEAEIAAAVASAADQMAKYGGRGGTRAGLAGFLVALDGFLAYEDYQAIQDFNAENAAYAEEMHAIGVMNQALLAHPRPSPLAGRYTGGRPPTAGGGGDDDDECRKEWEEAYERCRGLIANNGPIRLRGSKGGRPYTNVEDCASGFVSKRCGGNPIDWGKLK